MGSGDTPRPLPVPDELTGEFWDAVNEGRLVIQRCLDCGHYTHPPLTHCDACLSDRLKFEEVSGRGKIYTFTITRRKFVEGFQDPPYAIVVVELAEQAGLHMLSGWEDEAGAPEVGMEVRFRPLHIGDGMALPMFASAAAGEDA